MENALVGKEIGRRIYSVRGHRVMLDSDLAALYEVPPKRLNEQVRRNVSRFPADFMFQLSRAEYDSLRSQIATLETGRGKHRKYLPLVFTEHGVAMLSSVLNSERAVQVNIAIVRTFIQLREMLDGNKELARKIDQLERKFLQHDQQFKAVFDALRQIVLASAPPSRKRIKALSKE